MRPLRVDLDDDLYLRLKLRAAKERRSMKSIVIEALERLLSEKQEEVKRP